MSAVEIIEKLNQSIDVPSLIICLAGLAVFGIWLGRTSVGRTALADSRPRRNNMPLYLPFVILLFWFCSAGLAVAAIERLLPDLSDWQSAIVNNAVICVSAVAVVGLTLFLVRAHFARGLKGFGLNLRNVHRDFAAAFLNLLAAWPLLLAAIVVTSFFGKIIFGPEFEMQQHEELELITTYSQWPLRIIIIAVAVVVAPVLEEVLFRGLFQTMIRSFLETRYTKSETPNRMAPAEGDAQRVARPAPTASSGTWLAIVFCSGLFALVHQEPAHWPALFILGMCLGYAYEKSGSLLRPIFIHAIFNGLTILLVLRGA